MPKRGNTNKSGYEGQISYFVSPKQDLWKIKKLVIFFMQSSKLGTIVQSRDQIETIIYKKSLLETAYLNRDHFLITDIRNQQKVMHFERKQAQNIILAPFWP